MYFFYNIIIVIFIVIIIILVYFELYVSFLGVFDAVSDEVDEDLFEMDRVVVDF